MINCRKRAATLLEVLIAMALTVAVLTTLTFFYREVSFIDSEIDNVRAEQFKLRYVENRLGNVLPKAISEKNDKKGFTFFSIDDAGLTLPGTQSLIFIYDNGVSLDPPFSNHVLGRLYVDLEGRLTLMYWPSPKRWESGSAVPMKKEVLLEHVEALSFAFFVPINEPPEPAASHDQAAGESATEAHTPQVQGQLSGQLWSHELKKLPAMIKVLLEQKAPKSGDRQEMTFIFPLPNTRYHVVYP